MEKANYPLLNVHLPSKPKEPESTASLLLLIFSAVGFLGIIFASAIGSLTLTFLTAFISLAAITYFAGQDYLKETKYKQAYSKWLNDVALFTAGRVQPVVENHIHTALSPEGQVTINNDILPYLKTQVLKQAYNEQETRPVHHLLVGVAKKNGTEKVYDVDFKFSVADGVTVGLAPVTVSELLKKDK